MAKPNIKLAESLEILRLLQQEVGDVIKSEEVTRTHRERLSKNNFLQEVTKGWYIIANPQTAEGDTTPWYTTFWKFCKRYLEDKYKQQYCLSPEQSLLLHAGNTTIPNQLIIKSPHAPNKAIDLLYGTSLYIMRTNLDIETEIDQNTNLRVLTKEASIIASSPTIFKRNPIEVRTLLAQMNDTSELLRLLLDGSHSVIAGRIIGALKNIGNENAALEIKKTMEIADFKIRIEDPFSDSSPDLLELKARSPIVNRINLLWNHMREDVIRHFPTIQSPNLDIEEYLKSLDELYVTDAYHSLSIENYVVSPELIEKLKSGEWDLEEDENKKPRDAMAARGYWQAFKSVKESIRKVLEGQNSGLVFDMDHGEWYRQLFEPSVTAGILKVSDLAGYRNSQVYISNSQHTPLKKEMVREAMPALVNLLKNEEEASVRIILGHFIFVYIHPYMDGNGRMGRFLMNLMLASGGFPWTVVPVEKRDEYMTSLEEASVRNNIIPFSKLIAELVENSINGTPEAKV